MRALWSSSRTGPRTAAVVLQRLGVVSLGCWRGVPRPSCRVPEDEPVAVREEIVLDLPFGDLLHFVKDDVETAQPKVLVVAPMSGHFATLLRSTVATLLQDHDVYITDWKNARDVPMEAGRFGFDHRSTPREISYSLASSFP